MFAYDTIPEQELKKVDNICVICWGLIGDVFIRISLLESLKIRFPNASLTVIVDPVSAVALENHPDVDELVKLSRKKVSTIKYLSQLLKTLYRLNRKRFDLSVDSYCGGSSVLATRLINARLRICYNHKRSLRAVNNYLVKKPDFCDNWTMELCKLLLPLGITETRRGTSYFCSRDSLEFADSWLADKEGKKAVINLGAGAENKIWSIKNYVSLAESISENDAFHLIILSNPGQNHLVQEFKALAPDKLNYSILPETSFANVAAVISRVGLIITGDTSIMHLAFGLKCPTLGIFTRTRPEIVDPEDSLHVACFKEGKEKDNCGKYYGTQELTAETSYGRFRELMLLIE